MMCRQAGQAMADRAMRLGYIDAPVQDGSNSPASVVDPETTPLVVGHASWPELVAGSLDIRGAAPNGFKVLDLFAGCGGLALGFEAAGFETHGFEMDADAAASYRKNLLGDCTEVKLSAGYDYGFQPDLIIGGPPCQPFSVIGHQRGSQDDRDGFPVFIDAVARLQPRLAIIENVRGLMYQSRPYLDAVVAHLTALGYQVDYRLLKATDFGVPQNRERVVITASRVGWTWPKATVSKAVTAGTALGELASQAPDDGRYLTPAQDAYIARYEAKSKCVTPRDLHLNKPARTLTCRNFGASTSDMHRIKLADGRRRMLTVREGARLQSFPDWFEFVGREASVTKQIGNAVAPLFARALADAALRVLREPRQVSVHRLELRQEELAL